MTTHNSYKESEIDTTPQQVESLASGDAEWKNGDECKYMNNSVIYKFIGTDTDDLDCCWIKAPSGQLNMVGIHHLSSTAETPQQRQEREELEAAYELYCTGCNAVRHKPVDFDAFEGLSTKDRYLAIVRKTKYRKEVK